jgi:hypothetical protein
MIPRLINFLPQCSVGQSFWGVALGGILGKKTIGFPYLGLSSLSFLRERLSISQVGFTENSGVGAILLIKRKKRIAHNSQLKFPKGLKIMKRTILAGLTLLMAVAAASPASALSPRFRDAHRLHNDVTGNVVSAPVLTTDASLNQRFRDARTENLNNKLNPRFKEARTANLNNKLNERFRRARTENLNNKLNPRFKEARDRNTYN